MKSKIKNQMVNLDLAIFNNLTVSLLVSNKKSYAGWNVNYHTWVFS